MTKQKMDEDRDGDFVTDCPTCGEFTIVTPRGSVVAKCAHLVETEWQGDKEVVAVFRSGGRK